ncbi:HNH endonuclease signature motif containing protein [Blastococcus sp. CT_GayMR16]|uniref:HNH endonuclease signature motif containing protein n=1 Tax=Blastococcus sp. CT_GayMR16 TaxID=2559607 RepID=UPI001073CE9B|nr:HNH endonuclease signature motif containing protein [Blastococcus sp. CT_GayMR16]TFV86546.1 HNH endonuclease [Blastococcus sp. CT_GayMR16]
MFEGDGFGVGLTINQLDALPCPGAELVPADPDRHPTRLGELMPVAARDDVGLGQEMRRANIADSRLWAYRLEMTAQLAARRRDDRDRAPDRPGAAVPGWTTTSWVLDGYSEFLPDEVALIMNCSRAEATRLTEAALILVHRMPDTWAALADGELNWPRARAVAAEIVRHGPDLDPHVLAQVEAVVLPQAAELAVSGLRALLRAELIKRDAEAADRRRGQAEKAADVRLRRSVHEGMTELVTVVPHPVAAAMFGMVDVHARQAKSDGDQRPIGQLRAEVMAHSTLRPWDESRPAVTAELRVLAPLAALLPDPADPAVGGEPAGNAAVEDEPITAAHLRALLTALDAVCPGGLQAPTAGSLHLDLLGAGGNLLATLTRRELERAARRGCRLHPGGDCRCAIVERPPATDSYRPTDAQRRWGRARDRHCRHPGCRNQVGRTDLDHVIAHADGGATDCDNLCCLCRRHHRLKTHAPGWHFRLDPDGALLVTTPTGVTRISRPPGAAWLEPYELGALPPGLETLDPAPF